MKRKISIGIGLLCLVLLVVAGVFLGKKIQDKNATVSGDVAAPGQKEEIQQLFPYEVAEGVYVMSAEAYSGAFVEDGSDREIENIWQIKIENTTGRDIQFLRVRANLGGEEAVFDVSTLIAGSSAMVLETNALAWKSGVEQMSFTAENLAYFQYERTIFPEVFSLSVTDQTLRLENISENDVSGDVYVYYKNMEEDVFIGGITYRVKFSGGIRAGEALAEQASHYQSDKSKILFITYGQ